MRIFTAVRHSSDPRFYYGGLWSGNFYPALRALGHEVIESQVDLLSASRFMQVADGFTVEEAEVRGSVTARVVEEVRRAHGEGGVDLVLSYFYNAHFEPAGFDAIHRLGIPTVNFYCNSIYQFEHVAAIAAKATFAWHPEKAAASRYRQVGARPVWVQMGADPKVYRPLADRARQPKACFVGQRYADRDRWLATLLEAGVPLDIYGPGWQRRNDTALATPPANAYLGRRQRVPGSLASYLNATCDNFRRDGFVGATRRTWRQLMYRERTRRIAPLFWPHACGPIPFDRISEVVAEYAIVLSASNVWADGRSGSELIPHVRLRDFEAPMCRTCYLTGYTAELAEFYELGSEVETYSTPGELTDKTRFYLSHDAEAERLREAGYRRARRDHTWERRFSQLFREIGL